MMGGGHMGGMSEHCRGEEGSYGSGNTVVISGYSFNPQSLKIPVGTTVTWTNLDRVAHSVESGNSEVLAGVFGSGLLDYGESYSYTFNQPGTYTYHCGPHPYMTATITVEG